MKKAGGSISVTARSRSLAISQGMTGRRVPAAPHIVQQVLAEEAARLDKLDWTTCEESYERAGMVFPTISLDSMELNCDPCPRENDK